MPSQSARAFLSLFSPPEPTARAQASVRRLCDKQKKPAPKRMRFVLIRVDSCSKYLVGTVSEIHKKSVSQRHLSYIETYIPSKIGLKPSKTSQNHTRVCPKIPNRPRTKPENESSPNTFLTSKHLSITSLIQHTLF